MWRHNIRTGASGLCWRCGRRLVCPDCGGKEVGRKGRRFRELQTVPIGLKPVFLVTEVPQCQCLDCGKPSRSPPLCPGLCALHPPAQSVHRRPVRPDDGQRSGRPHRSGLGHRQEHHQGQAGKGWPSPAQGTAYLSIDEIYLGRTQRFFTLVIDLDRGRIVWVAPGAVATPCASSGGRCV